MVYQTSSENVTALDFTSVRVLEVSIAVEVLRTSTLRMVFSSERQDQTDLDVSVEIGEIPVAVRTVAVIRFVAP